MTGSYHQEDIYQLSPLPSAALSYERRHQLDGAGFSAELSSAIEPANAFTSEPPRADGPQQHDTNSLTNESNSQARQEEVIGPHDRRSASPGRGPRLSDHQQSPVESQGKNPSLDETNSLIDPTPTPRTSVVFGLNPQQSINDESQEQQAMKQRTDNSQQVRLPYIQPRDIMLPAGSDAFEASTKKVSARVFVVLPRPF